jgi:pullulanase
MRHFWLLLTAAALLAAAAPAMAQTDVTLTIHYHRFDDTYAGWGLHMWDAVEWEAGGIFYVNGVQYNWTSPLPPTGTDAFGVYWEVPIAYPDVDLGFIIHNGDVKDPGPDMSWGDYVGHPEIWILSGFTQIFTEEPNPDVRLMSAVSDGEDTFTLTLARDATQLNAFHVFKDGVEQAVASRGTTSARTVVLTVVDAVDITAPYTVTDDVGGNVVSVLHRFDPAVYVYDGEDLGCTYGPSATTFKLWSPVAASAKVRIYENPYPVDGESWSETELTRAGEAGVMQATVSGDLEGRYYLYEMTVYGQTYLTPDAYSVAMSSNSRRSMIVDLADTDPPGWDADQFPSFPEIESVVYELHVRDVTAGETWTGTEANRHKFLGVVEPGTSWDGVATGFDHILSLGVNTVQILPMFDFASVDENDPASRNWGYDPLAYNVPEGSYASAADDGRVRIREMKAMIQAFHAAGIKVVMDVVYNHTNGVGPAASLFDAMVPKYYYRLNADGSYSNGSGVGNEIATEQPMAHRFILQSVKYWVEEYRIDGFRFDLMGLIDTDLMAELTQEIKAINPHALIYGEPWGGYGTTPLTGKGDQRGLGFGCFNDNIRNAIRGSTDGTDAGYAMGDLNDRAAVVRGLDGAITDFTDGPTETINYISAHDNYTWWDKLDHRWNPTTPPPHYGQDELIRMDRFGASMVLTAQGIPFIHGGCDFLRTKRTGDPAQDEETIRNSYAAGDDVNALDWARKVTHLATFDYYSGLIELRLARPELRLPTAADIQDHQHALTVGVPTGVIAYTLDDVTPGDGWGALMVVHNATALPVSLPLAAGHWEVVVDEDEAGTTPVTTGVSRLVSTDLAPAVVEVPRRSTVVLHQAVPPGVQINLFQNPALDSYLHLAVNAVDGTAAVTVTVNGDAVSLAELADGSWYGSYVMSEGTLTVELTTPAGALVRRFNVVRLGGGAVEARTLDGNACLALDGEASTAGGMLAVFDAAGRPDLPAGACALGPAAVRLAAFAQVRLRTARADQVVQRLDDGQWCSLVSWCEDGWVVATTDRLGVFRLAVGEPVPARTELAGNAPNPFNPHTTIRFVLGAADGGQAVSLRVYDATGRLVRTLHAGVLAPGAHAFAWDGTDGSGRQAASGVYLYRLQTVRRTLAGRMLLLK